MAKNIILIPTRAKVGLISVTMGLARKLEQHGVNYDFFSPISMGNAHDREHQLINNKKNQHGTIDFSWVAEQVSNDNWSAILEAVIAHHADLPTTHDLIIIKGLSPHADMPFIEKLNAAIARALNADIILVTMPDQHLNQLNDTIDMTASAYHSLYQKPVYGCIINKVGAPVDADGIARLDLAPTTNPTSLHQQIKDLPVFKKRNIQCLGIIDWNKQLYAPRLIDILDGLDAKIIHPGDMENRRISYLKLCARSVNTLLYVLVSNTLIITAGDRADIVIAAALAEMRGIELAAVVLTGNYDICPDVLDFCKPAFDTGLTILSVTTDSFQTATRLKHIDTAIPLDDTSRIELVRDTMAQQINCDQIIENIHVTDDIFITPPAFMYRLLQKAKANKKTIILPEGSDPRILQAANDCVKQGIVNCIIFGKKNNIIRVAKSHHITLHPELTILNPDTIRDKYITPLCQARKHKNMTTDIAIEWLKDDIVLATIMLQQGDVDGLVAGAVHSTASTIRPALQLIKTKPPITKVSSLFFMCMPSGVLVFADCAINPNPTADDLADIALIAANTAADFGIKPRVAMLSYSTGSSGSGSDVEKIKQATEKLQSLAPDLLVDGPLQYDAAINPSVAKIKAPNSPVAGQASVLIFPDLNTGNTTYKAVQRSANIICMGPVLLGLNRPVNDLSRGCSIKDIMFTIAITAIQAQTSSN